MSLFAVVVILVCLVTALYTVKAVMDKRDAKLEDLETESEDLPGDDVALSISVSASVAAAPPSKKDIWVVPFRTELDKKVKWAVKEEENGEPLTLTVTQAEAEKEGRRLAKENKVELFVQGRDRKIRKKNSYGHDPSNVKG